MWVELHFLSVIFHVMSIRNIFSVKITGCFWIATNFSKLTLLLDSKEFTSFMTSSKLNLKIEKDSDLTPELEINRILCSPDSLWLYLEIKHKAKKSFYSTNVLRFFLFFEILQAKKFFSKWHHCCWFCFDQAPIKLVIPTPIKHAMDLWFLVELTKSHTKQTMMGEPLKYHPMEEIFTFEKVGVILI